LYGVIRRPGTRSKLSHDVLRTGVGNPAAPVEFVAHGQVAAVSSTVSPGEIGEAAGARALRRDMAAHSDVLARVLDHVTVLPARFGIIFPNVEVMLGAFLQPQHDHLLAALERLRGLVEVSVRADLIEEPTIEAIARASPRLVAQLQQSNARPAGARYHERIELGRRIALGIQAKRDQEARWLTDRISPAVRDIQLAEPPSDLCVLRGSVLVGRNALDRFDQLMNQIAGEAGSRMKLACVGPLPPYSFVDLHVPAGDT
jgi:hypothetical protein